MNTVTSAERYPAHDRKFFFKYVTAPTALKILESAKVRYSSPIIFNDPFDIQSGLHFDFDIETHSDRLLDFMEKLVLQEEKPDVLESEPWGQAVLLMREKKTSHGFPKEKWREAAGPLFAVLVESLKTIRIQYQETWWCDFLPRLRVFSVSESHDNLLMWSHYAKDHSGAVLQFRVLPEEDNPLCIAKPILYRQSPPSFLTEKEWLEFVLLSREPKLSELFVQYAYMKSDIWSYEREWRVWDLLPRKEESLFSEYPVLSQELEAIYFGCKIDPVSRVDIERLMISRYPLTRSFQARKAEDQFKLYFDAL